jgi:hypothetical protein
MIKLKKILNEIDFNDKYRPSLSPDNVQPSQKKPYRIDLFKEPSDSDPQAIEQFMQLIRDVFRDVLDKDENAKFPSSMVIELINTLLHQLGADDIPNKEGFCSHIISLLEKEGYNIIGSSLEGEPDPAIEQFMQQLRAMLDHHEINKNANVPSSKFIELIKSLLQKIGAEDLPDKEGFCSYIISLLKKEGYKIVDEPKQDMSQLDKSLREFLKEVARILTKRNEPSFSYTDVKSLMEEVLVYMRELSFVINKKDKLEKIFIEASHVLVEEYGFKITGIPTQNK